MPIEIGSILSSVLAYSVVREIGSTMSRNSQRKERIYEIAQTHENRLAELAAKDNYERQQHDAIRAHQWAIERQKQHFEAWKALEDRRQEQRLITGQMLYQTGQWANGMCLDFQNPLILFDNSFYQNPNDEKFYNICDGLYKSLLFSLQNIPYCMFHSEKMNFHSDGMVNGFLTTEIPNQSAIAIWSTYSVAGGLSVYARPQYLNGIRNNVTIILADIKNEILEHLLIVASPDSAYHPGQQISPDKGRQIRPNAINFDILLMVLGLVTGVKIHLMLDHHFSFISGADHKYFTDNMVKDYLGRFDDNNIWNGDVKAALREDIHSMIKEHVNGAKEIREYLAKLYDNNEKLQNKKKRFSMSSSIKNAIYDEGITP